MQGLKVDVNSYKDWLRTSSALHPILYQVLYPGSNLERALPTNLLLFPGVQSEQHNKFPLRYWINPTKEQTNNYIQYQIQMFLFGGVSFTSTWDKASGRPKTHCRDFAFPLGLGIPKEMSGLICLDCCLHEPTLEKACFILLRRWGTVCHKSWQLFLLQRLKHEVWCAVSSEYNSTLKQHRPQALWLVCRATSCLLYLQICWIRRTSAINVSSLEIKAENVTGPETGNLPIILSSFVLTGYCNSHTDTSTQELAVHWPLLLRVNAVTGLR